MRTKKEHFPLQHIVGHLDMDAFFAAIEERNNPQFAGLPIVVGADPQGGRGRGVASTANYKAREYGIRSATPISAAWRMSEEAARQGKPRAMFLSGSFGRYGETSRRIMTIIQSFAPIMQRRSVDEAYFDLGFAGSFEGAAALCQKIKGEISFKERLTASVGIGPNKLIAKIASDFRKPDGLTVVVEGDVEAFLNPLPIRVIPGVGPKTEAYLRRLGIMRVSDAKRFSREELSGMLGKWGEALFEKVRGRDDSLIREAYRAKSIGEQVTFRQDTRDPGLVMEHLFRICEGLIERLTEEGFRSFRTVTITVRFSDFETVSRARTCSHLINSVTELRWISMKLLLPFFDRRENPHGKLLRLIGVRLEKLM